MQVGEACERSPRCFFYRLEDRAAAAQELTAWPGAAAAVSDLGYGSKRAFERDVQKYMEPMYLLSQFCLTPPGARAAALQDLALWG